MKLFLVSFTLFAMLTSCSSEDAQDGDKGQIKTATDKVAAEMVEKIQGPLDKANAIKTTEEQRTKQIGKQVE